MVVDDDCHYVKWIDGNVFYSRKNFARRPASVFTMDCLAGLSSDTIAQYSNGMNSERFCVENLPFNFV